MKKVLVMIVCLNFISCTSNKITTQTASLVGTWELNYITGPKIVFSALYPNRKPTIVFDLENNKVSGNNSCNQYTGALLIEDSKINFKENKMAMTMMACQGSGDTLYMEMLNKIETYTISEDGKTLSFLIGNIVMMRFAHLD